MIFVGILAHVVTHERVYVRTRVASGTQPVHPLRPQRAQLQLLLQHLHSLFPQFVELGVSGEELQAQCDEAEVFIVVLEFEYAADCFVFHDVFYVDGDFGHCGFGQDFNF